MREENDRIRSEAALDKRIALLAAKRADSRPIYDASNPHPRSITAQRAGLPPRKPVAEVNPGAFEEFLAFKAPEWSDDK